MFLVVEQESPVFGPHQLQASHVNSSVARDDTGPLVMFRTSLKDGQYAYYHTGIAFVLCFCD